MADIQAQLQKLQAVRKKTKSEVGLKAIDAKIAKLESQMPKKEVEAVEKAVKAPAKKAKAPKAPKASAAGKEKRHVFEKKVEGGKEVKVVMATSEDLAKEAMQDSGFDFVKTITRGRSPKEGFVADAKPKKAKSKKPERATRASRAEMAQAAGMTPEKAEKVAEKVSTAKKRGRKPMDKKAFLFEMPMKTKAGKVKRKVVTAVSEAAAVKQAGKNYSLVRELKAGENPKVGIQPIEGYVKPEPKKRGRKPKVKEEAPEVAVEVTEEEAMTQEPEAKVDESVEEKAEAIGEGISIANKEIADQLMDLVNRQILDMEEKADILKMEAQNLSIQAGKLGDKIAKIVKDLYGED
jgi:hypothetical protein